MAIFRATLLELLGVTCSPALCAAIFQGVVGLSPGVTPEITQIKPNETAPGSKVKIEIEGRNLSRGAYVSFSNPAVHVISTRRSSATKLEAKVAIGIKAQPGKLALYVSNPTGSAAEAPFTIVGAPAPSAAPTAGVQPSELGAPEVTAVDPHRATPGSQLTLKIIGKNFAPGAKVSFSNPSIRVLETNAPKTTELTVRIQISPDASMGTTGLFVVNPDDREAETSFEVTDGSLAKSPAPSKATASSKSAASVVQRFEVLNLGNVINIIQTHEKPKGTLTLAAGKLKFEEEGKEVFLVTPKDIKEIDVNSILGVNTGTFHIILNSGKKFNFIASSLRPADSQFIVDSLRRALH